MSLSRECIIGPHQALDGLLTAPHIQLNPPILSPVEDGRQMLSIRYRSGQGHLLSLMDAIPVQQSKALQPHVLNSPLPHHPTLLVGPFPQMSSNALASLSLSFTLL